MLSPSKPTLAVSSRARWMMRARVASPFDSPREPGLRSEAGDMIHKLVRAFAPARDRWR
jgi:hypothetical protein